MLRIIVSACLLGLNTKYDGGNNRDEKIISILNESGIYIIPVCPEQLGGLPTPRDPADLTDSGEYILDGKGKVITWSGEDVTKYFIKGAYEVLKVAKLYNAKIAILKARSPSCGVDGAYQYRTRELKPWNGVTAALLKREGIRVINNEKFDLSLIKP